MTTSGPDRSLFTTTRGALFATAGVAIGLGNIWRFPYMMGRDGGVVFLLVYLVFALTIGAPMLIAEW
ncbi:MAG: sodium-dependent transporter, partial [Gemmatimonadetes bacterium]